MAQVELTPLDYDPFEGDYGSSGDIVFSDTMVKARKQHRCSHCNSAIAVGEIHRSRYEKNDGELYKFRWCAECCKAMVKELETGYEGDEYPFQERHNLIPNDSYEKGEVK